MCVICPPYFQPQPYQTRCIDAASPKRQEGTSLNSHMLSSAIKEAPNIKYAKLPKTKSTKDDVKGPCTAIGWGKLHGNSDNYDAHPLLQHVVLDVISTVECMKLYERGVKIGKSICTFTPGKDACQQLLEWCEEASVIFPEIHHHDSLQDIIQELGIDTEECETEIPLHPPQPEQDHH
ncbi:unnamed protein product [Timema podura]|uniref:Peptidase S1 domain-containing protein n=1 Tax=Timema podura TaxID=61482 RepID=A0ABN7NV13_TIMPD|nr:unnamed protein product [Timema podura]